MTARRCSATTKGGKACRAWATQSTPFCSTHGVDRVDASRAHTGRWDRSAFLQAFADAGTIAEACRMVGVSRQMVYKLRQHDEDFRTAWEDVDAEIVERLEAEAFRRAHDGVSEPIVSAGHVVTNRQVFSDGLLMFLLKARRPEMYRDRVDVSNRHSGGLTVETDMVSVSRDPAHSQKTWEILKGIGVVTDPDLSKLSVDELRTLEEITGKLERTADPEETTA